MQTYLEWIKAGLEKPGKDIDGLASALGLHTSSGYKILWGDRKIVADELIPISKYLEEPIPNLGYRKRWRKV